MFRTLLETKKAEAEAEYKKYTKVRKSVYEYLGIPQSAYLICTDNVKSKMFRLYYNIFILGQGKLFYLFHLIFWVQCYLSV